ncbi:glutathione S-transferase N-terminal domain-containing protein [Salinisphaera sp.]|uniref:glutathione S-transferase N-terminal domain-containing protein n=1 Tax=Salinisphaera sp. TaxID=1914330 RepID=UPI000C65985D|nr:glutathione S-transferase N-terminal domain-containing protein [Salinisphaera sp.]MBS63790.1 glutathione S-transferase [Salinisphaera sp.]
MPVQATPHVLYGAPHSLYTGKARCYLRNQGIAYIERPTSHPDYVGRIAPAIGRSIIPVLETPQGEIIQDSIDIIDHCERAGTQWPVYPGTPLQHIVAVIIEYFGGQAMLKHAMHYRWSYLAEQRDFLWHAFVSGSGEAVAEKLMGRMHSYLPMLGVTDRTIPLLERSFETLLDTLDAHFAVMPYLLGWRPSIADYGLIAPLFAHLGRDPVPANIMKTRAPRVFRWVERMNAPGLDRVEYPEQAAAWIADDAIPPSLEPFLAYVAEEIFPELDDKLAFIDDWVAGHKPGDGDPVTDKPHRRQLGTVATRYRGEPIEVGVEPYLLYVLQRAADTMAIVNDAASQRVRSRLEQLGLARAVPYGRDYRVARENNIEVWRYS